MEIYGRTMHKGLDFDNDLVFYGHMYAYHQQNADYNLIIKKKCFKALEFQHKTRWNSVSIVPYQY